MSTANFMVDFPIIENQIESLTETLIWYLPNESVTVPRPELLITATASSGLLAEMSYTLPLIKTDWAWVICTNKPNVTIKLK